MILWSLLFDRENAPYLQIAPQGQNKNASLITLLESNPNANVLKGLNLHKDRVASDLTLAGFTGFQIFKSGNPAGYPVGTIWPDFRILTNINFETFQDELEIISRKKYYIFVFK